ncbi:DUF805 domain-containing protein [Phenylobacterium sp. NIBR 498073]|uniref:DUF805 domain-containing protein n=1 Tax=Phenylobacterium sp. NIBR 498073 TaxID=3015177 RepID=UPI0022B42EAC|nr:DUF805 domain-containing protein [Phenylobacterium sp. NIBR 498073]MBS0491263.1 DUF805 domain-containing protein [Pseudomonadota bacterium]WGU39558.1 DUF805 domain-containing protein [Phenylobacterium sp. NIBR 498073]
MSDQPPPKAEKRRWSLKARAGRKEYWFWFGVMCVLSLIISYLPGEPSTFSLAVAFAFIQVRRLHDFGRSGWWVVPFFVLPLALPLIALELGLQEGVTLLVTLALCVAAYIWMGVRKGDAGDNRFGPPPASDLKSALLGG